MINLTDQSFLGQPSALRDFQDRAEQMVESLSNGSRASENSLDYKLDRLKTNAVKTLFFVLTASPNMVQMVEIGEKTDIHRSTVSVHMRELEDLELIEKEILSGTENKYKPTYLYRLNPSVDRQRVREIFEAKFPNDPLLNLGTQPLGSFDGEQTDLALESKREQTQGESDVVEEEGIEQKIATIINAMAEEIVSLENRVSELEQKLDQKSQSGKQVDFSQAMHLLKTMKTGGGKP